MATKRPLAPNATTGNPAVINPPDTIDPAVLPPATTPTPLPGMYAAS